MKKASIFFICIITLTAFCIWAPDSFAEQDYYTSTPGLSISCSICHYSAAVSCAACHYHGSRNITATTDQTAYQPGDTVTVSISGSSNSRDGWVRTILYDQDGNEVARSTGLNGMGGGPQFPGPITLTAPAPAVPGTYAWSASWYGHSFRDGKSSNNFVPDPGNSDHGEVFVFTNDFEVIGQCDTNAPTVTAPANMTITLAAGNSGPVPVSDSRIQNFLNGAVATDAEDGNLPVTSNAPADFPVGTTPVTFFATDSCDNQGSSTANVTVEVADNNLPVVTPPAAIEVTAPLCKTSIKATDSAIVAFLNAATADDVEDGDVTASITNDAPSEFPVGTVTTVTFTASDSLGANGTATATVTVYETPNTGPAITAPAAITIMVPAGTISLPDAYPEIVGFLSSATATDAEDGDLTALITNDAPADFPVGTTSVTFSIADSCGVLENASSTITIQEEGGNIAPVLNVPDPITINAQLCENSVPDTSPAIDAFLKNVTATDTEDGDVTALIIHDAPAYFPTGMTPVTFSVTDSGGATTTGVSSVTVVNLNNAPVVIGPAPLLVTVAAGTTSVPATDTAIAAFLNGATATDIEDGDFSSSAITHNAPADFPLGIITTVVFSVTDSCGVSASASSTVTIEEEQPPIVVPPSEEDDDEVDDDKNENGRKNGHYKNKKHKKEPEYYSEETQSSQKLRLLRDDDD